MGEASSFTQLEYLAGKHWVNNNYSGYGIDNWHVNIRLTLNLGLRLRRAAACFRAIQPVFQFREADYNTSLGNPVTAAGTLNPACASPLTTGTPFYLNGIEEAGVNGFPRGNVQNKYNTWQPRVGFAYDLFGNGKTVLRGGFGMFYERFRATMSITPL